MRKLLVFVTLLALALVSRASAQTASERLARATETLAGGFSTYRLDFSFNELEDGKKLNTRSYTMVLQDSPMSPASAWSDSMTMKAVTRVPVVTNDNKGQSSTVFVDVGLEIFSRLRPHGNGTLDIDGRVELSSLAQPDQAASGHPVLRTVESSFSAEVTLGKPMLIASMDDINSTRRYEVELTATKLK
jgi:hypothetical protein